MGYFFCGGSKRERGVRDVVIVFCLIDFWYGFVEWI